MGEIETMLFDVDGTLADSVDLFYEMSCEIVVACGGARPPRARVLELMGEGDPEILTKLLPPGITDARERVDALARERIPAWIARYGAETQPLPGAVEAVRRLGARGIVLGIVTSSPRALPFLARWGVREHFGAIVGREDVAERKPHPAGLHAALDRLGRGAERAVYVGDSLVDARAARAAGMRFAAVSSGATPRDRLAREAPDWLLDSLAELERALFPGADR